MTKERASVIALVMATSITVSAQKPGEKPGAPVRPPIGATVSEESMLVYQGWALIASGDVSKASRHAADLLEKFPRSVSVLALGVEADILRAGAVAGLDVYDRWLGKRTVEDAYALRRIARALLWTSARSRDVAASESLQLLATDGDVEARLELTRRAYAGSLPDAKALAALDEGAVRFLLGALGTTKGSKLPVIDALVASKNRLAIQPLIGLLGDLNRTAEVAAAADGLGKLGAAEAIPRLQPLAAEKNVIPAEIKWAASGALFRLQDSTGLALLQRSLGSNQAALRLAAADAMASRPDEGWKQVVRGLTVDPAATIRLQAARLIAPYDLLLARGIIEPELANPDAATRATAAQYLAEHGGPDLPTLRKLLRSTDPLARIQAAGRVLVLTQ